jgi:tetratricopeptide (TPR) repeat protein
LSRQKNDWESARRYMARALSVPSARETALFDLIYISYQLGEWSDAVEYAERLLEVDRYDTRVYAMLADCLWSLGQFPEAIEAVQRAVELNPGSIPLREWLADRYRRTGRDEEWEREQRVIDRLRSARIPTSLRGATPD